MPRTAATVGTSEYFSFMLVAWKLAIMASKASTLPACSRPMAPLRSAPAEKGSPLCHSTRPLKPFSASSTQRCSPSSTASLTVFILVLKEATATSSPRCHRRTPSFSQTVLPGSNFSPSSGSGKR